MTNFKDGICVGEEFKIAVNLAIKKFLLTEEQKGNNIENLLGRNFGRHKKLMHAAFDCPLGK